MSSANSFTFPAIVPINTWGYAVEKQAGMSSSLGFDSTYTIDDASNKYANLPTIDQTIYQTDQWPAPITGFRAYYASRLTLATTAGVYGTTITYTALGADIPEPIYTACVNGPQFKGNIGNIIDADTVTAGWVVGDTGIATDTRNGQDYCIGRLADGNVWMLNNLKLANYNATVDDTDLNSGAVATNGFAIPAMYTVGNYSSDSPVAYGPLTSNVTYNNEDYNVTDLASDHFGGYLYNWPAVTAGESRASMPAGSGNAPNSICPANWRLPTGGIDGEFAQLDIAMEGTGTTQLGLTNTTHKWRLPNGPFRGVFAGVWLGSFYSQGVIAYLWSASTDPTNTSSASRLRFDSDSVYPVDSDLRSGGSAVRCLLK
jgi:uncharacterized protein (TIGR02145 family)